MFAGATRVPSWIELRLDAPIIWRRATERICAASDGMGRTTISLSKRRSVLLASASSGGTIAAARHLAANGFDVGVVSSHRLGAAAWSRHTARTYWAPPESESQRFLKRLLAIGANDPGQILLPTSDETAWLYTLNATELGRYFRLVQPSIASSAEDPRQEAFRRCRDPRGASRYCRVGIREQSMMSWRWRRPCLIRSL